MLDYLLIFLSYGFIGFIASGVLLYAYEQSRSWTITPLSDEERRHIRSAMTKVSLGAAIVAGIIGVAAHSN
jgi:hypothetical protein